MERDELRQLLETVANVRAGLADARQVLDRARASIRQIGTQRRAGPFRSLDDVVGVVDAALERAAAVPRDAGELPTASPQAAVKLASLRLRADPAWADRRFTIAAAANALAKQLGRDESSIGRMLEGEVEKAMVVGTSFNQAIDDATLAIQDRVLRGLA